MKPIEVTGEPTSESMKTDFVMGLLALVFMCVGIVVLGFLTIEKSHLDRDGQIGIGEVLSVSEIRGGGNYLIIGYNLTVSSQHGELELLTDSLVPIPIGTRVEYIFSPTTGHAELFWGDTNKGDFLKDWLLSWKFLIMAVSTIGCAFVAYTALRDVYMVDTKKDAVVPEDSDN